jgi:putative ABC transport system substrate-binding protein
MRRRDLTIGLLLAPAIRTVWAQEPAKQHRIAIVASRPVALIDDSPAFRAFFEQLRRLGDIEGQNLTIERYSGGGKPEGYADLARGVIARNPDVIVAGTNPIAKSIHAASSTMPIVWIGVEGVRDGLATSLAHPGGSITGVDLNDYEVWGKRLQILKEAVPSASKVAFLMPPPRDTWDSVYGKQLREIGRRLGISLVGMRLDAATPSEYQRVFADIAPARPDAIVVHDRGDLLHDRQLIVELVENSRLPAMYGAREFIEVGGLMAYQADQGEAGRRMADDVHQILNGANPGDIPIYQPAKFHFIINLKATKPLGLTIPPTLLALADEVIE